ncbi:MAG: hypothetical protein JW704_13365 [Anaerolineaceae bacterium]|nr:hypothetical protein [Anaerolineaceae bacterium]MBN2678392.1 hypothetical protein [Anaerolineaceae bacterium]
MFQSLGRAWNFLKQSWLFGQRSPVVLYPSLISLIGSLLTMFVMLLPVAILIFHIRKNEWGQVAIGVLIGLLLIVLVAIMNTMSVMTSNLSGAILAGRQPNTSGAWMKLSDLGGGLYVMGLGLPTHHFWVALKSLFTKMSAKRGWENDDHLFIPVLANEDISFRNVPGRINDLQAGNSVFSARSVDIHKLLMLLSTGALIIGLAAGLGVGWFVLKNGQDASQARVLAFALAALMVAVFTLPVVLLSVYVITLFNTCLYQWGMSVHTARRKGPSGSAEVPEPLAVALGIRQGG